MYDAWSGGAGRRPLLGHRFSSSSMSRNYRTDSHFDLVERVILRCVVGSRAYGLDREGSDTDRRGAYLPPADLHWSLAGAPPQLQNESTQEVYWEIQKFIVLALKANPNVLECLYTPLVETVTPLGEELLAMRGCFLSRLVHQTYTHYVEAQFRRMQAGLRSRGVVKWRHAMHLLRLLLSGVTVLREGFVAVDVREHRERLLAVRSGRIRWQEVDAWRRELVAEFDAALARTTLPAQPDYERADRFLIRARRRAVEERLP